MSNMEHKNDIFVDVRPPEIYREGHVPGAINIPLDTLEQNAENKLPNKDAKISVYCQDGERSAKGAAILRSIGYTNVFDFGPVTNWEGALEK